MSPEARITVKLDGVVSHWRSITPCSEKITQSICNLEQEQKIFLFLWGQSHVSEEHKKSLKANKQTHNNKNQTQPQKNPEQAPREHR